MTVFRIARALVAFICGWSLFINKVLASHLFGLSMLHRKKDPFSVLRTHRGKLYPPAFDSQIGLVPYKSFVK